MRRGALATASPLPTPLFLTVSLGVAAILSAVACDNEMKPGHGWELKLPGYPDSPQAVTDNFEYAFDQMDIERIIWITHDDFTFVFEPADLGEPGIPPDGVMGREQFLDALRCMLDVNFVPNDPSEKLDNLTMETEISGDTEPSGIEGAPPGTVEAYVAIDLIIETVGGLTYLVNSRPEFFFAPDSTKTPVFWEIWRIVDTPFEAHLEVEGGSYENPPRDRLRRCLPLFRRLRR